MVVRTHCDLPECDRVIVGTPGQVIVKKNVKTTVPEAVLETCEPCTTRLLGELSTKGDPK